MEGTTTDLAASDAPDSEYGRMFRRLPRSSMPELAQAGFFNLGKDSEELRAIWSRHPTARGNASILVAASTHRAREETEEFLRLLLLLGSGMVVISAAIGTLIVSWALRPIGRTSAVLRQITHRNIGSEGLDVLRVPRELAPFVGALEEMLGRLGRALERQRQFTTDASHELRTPLTLAKSTLQAARTRDRGIAAYKQAIDETLGDLDRMGRLISQLLSLARMDERDSILQSEDVALDRMLRELAHVFDARASQAGGGVACPDPPHTLVKGDAGQLGQLFSNLLDNAITHGPIAGTVHITLEHGSDKRCTVSIEDDGGEIPPEALPHLFDRFYRVDSSRARATGGAGLGLAIARQIARRHGGDIEISSSPAAGTRVSVHLPRL